MKIPYLSRLTAIKEMKNLKTLKDLEEQDYLKMEDGKNFVSTKKIRQEAINWVKEMNKLETADDMIYEKNWEEIFKHFFNLTEEDLKNE